MGFLEFIGDFIAEFWIQLTQPKKKGFSPKKRRVLFNIGKVVVSLLMCLLLVYFFEIGNTKRIFSIVILFIVEIASLFFALSKRKRK